MIMLLSALISGIISQFPSLISVFRSAQDTKNQIELLKVQASLNLQAADHAALVSALQAATAERNNIRDSDATLSYSPGLAWLRAAVRPLITFLFLGLWLAVKIAVFVKAYQTKEFAEAVQWSLWDSGTQDIFSAIIAYHFGGRVGEKFAEKITGGLDSPKATPPAKK